MSKQVQVYFRNEDEAEQCRAKLSKYTTHNVMIDFIEGRDRTQLVIPQAPLVSGGSNSVNSGLGPYAMGFEELDDADKDVRNTVLMFEVNEGELNDVLREIQKIGGLVDRAIFE